MTDGLVIYAFEELGHELTRPSMAALRALLSQGIVVSPRAWQELPLSTRVRIAAAGLPEHIDEYGFKAIVREIPVSHLKFIGKTSSPSPTEVPAALLAALGPVRAPAPVEWIGLRPLDRHVLAALAHNPRLLSRALLEILPKKALATGGPNDVAGLVARSDIRVRHDVVAQVLRADFMDSRAFILANVAGRRAARRASELLDMHADTTVGPVEINWGFREPDDVLFWQAHVSSWDGTFFPAAALLAATTAATTFLDLVRTLDPAASVVLAKVSEEPWVAGRHEVAEVATELFAKPAGFTAAMGPSSLFSDTLLSDPPDMAGLATDTRDAVDTGPDALGSSAGPGSVRGPVPVPAPAVVPVRRPALPLWAIIALVAIPTLALLIVTLASLMLISRHG